MVVYRKLSTNPPSWGSLSYWPDIRFSKLPPACAPIARPIGLDAKAAEVNFPGGRAAGIGNTSPGTERV